VVQDVPSLCATDVLDRQHHALEAGDGSRRQRAGPEPEPEQMEIPVRERGGGSDRRRHDRPFHRSARLGAADLAMTIENQSEQLSVLDEGRDGRRRGARIVGRDEHRDDSEGQASHH
jgi:hypothetical protein